MFQIFFLKTKTRQEQRIIVHFVWPLLYKIENIIKIYFITLFKYTENLLNLV